MQQQAGRVVIGMDPHQMSVTIEVMIADETTLGGGRNGTDEDGFTAMRRYVSQIASRVEDRIWAVYGANGAGRSLAQRLLSDGERVVDVPTKLAARVRLFDTGHNRKTDAGRALDRDGRGPDPDRYGRAAGARRGR